MLKQQIEMNESFRLKMISGFGKDHKEMFDGETTERTEILKNELIVSRKKKQLAALVSGKTGVTSTVPSLPDLLLRWYSRKSFMVANHF